MPKSKRSKKVSLTITKKKGLECKHNFIDEIRTCANKYENIFIFSFENIKNNFVKEIRLAWRKNSRFFFCKNRVMAVALGRTSEEEMLENLHLVSNKLIGNRGLFFTDASKEEVLKYFDSFVRPEYPHAGSVATETFEVPEGPLEQFAHSLESHLRKLGLPTELLKSVPYMLHSHVVCRKGDILTPEQARLLKLFDRKTAFFKLTMEFMWSKDGSFDDFERTKGVTFSMKSKKKDKTAKQINNSNLESDGEMSLDEDEIHNDDDDDDES